MTKRPLAIAVAACLVLAAASLAIPSAPGYDAWAWLVWGRELAGLGLDTSSGPSWKPLPAGIAALLSPAGDAAPALWLVLVRAGWLLALVLAGGLAYRLTRGLHRALRSAGAGVAALSLLLLTDEITGWARQGLIGMSEPLVVVLVLGAVRAAVEDRARLTLALAGLAALVRPEIWPLLVAYGLWRGRAQPALRPLVAALALAVPVLWVAPDLLAGGGGSGSGERSLRGDGTPLEAALEVLERAATMPLAAVWPLALLAVLGPRAAAAAVARSARASSAPAATPPGAPSTRATSARSATAPGAALPRAPGGASVPALLACALALIAIVAAMAAAGFAGLPRFLAPAIAIAGVLAGVGLAWLLALARRPAAIAAVAVALLVLSVPQARDRAAALPDALTRTEREAQRIDRLRVLTGAIGAGPLLHCGKLATSYVLVRTALAWELRAPLAEVVSFGDLPVQSGAFVVGPGATAAARTRLESRARLLGRRGEWRIYSLDCSPTVAASSARKAGVTGARR